MCLSAGSEIWSFGAIQTMIGILIPQECPGELTVAGPAGDRYLSKRLRICCEDLRNKGGTAPRRPLRQGRYFI